MDTPNADPINFNIPPTTGKAEKILGAINLDATKQEQQKAKQTAENEALLNLTPMGPAPAAPTKTIKVIIQIAGESEAEVHETVLDYEGFTYDDKTQVFSFHGKQSVFQNKNAWTVSHIQQTTPTFMVNQLKENQQKGK